MVATARSSALLPENLRLGAGDWENFAVWNAFRSVAHSARAGSRTRTFSTSGLDWADACLTPERNERPVRTSSVWQARQPVYKTSVGG